MFEVLRPGGWISGIDLKEAFTHWLVAPVARRWLGFRHEEAGFYGAHVFLPMGLGLSPAENDRNVKEAVRVFYQVARSPPSVLDYVDDLRQTRGDELATSEAQAKKDLQGVFFVFSLMGLLLHTKKSKLIEPTKRCPWLGFEVW